jgi:WD40 repeat protein
VFGWAIAPDGKTILSGSNEKTARLWDVATGKEIRQFVGHTASIWRVAFAPDGKTVLTASTDGTARLWDVATGAEMRRLQGHTDLVRAVAYAPDGKTVVTGSADHTARQWHVSTEDTVTYLCSRLLRDFSDEERKQYGITGDSRTCPAP